MSNENDQCLCQYNDELMIKNEVFEDLHAKYAAVVAELECAQNDIELRDREIQALKYKNTLEAAKHAELMVMIPKLKAETIREAVKLLEIDEGGGLHNACTVFELLEYADELEQGK